MNAQEDAVIATLAEQAMTVAARAAREYARKEGKLDLLIQHGVPRLHTALVKHVKAAIPELLKNAKVLYEGGMSGWLEEEFAVDMSLAGINAAKEALL